MERTEEEKLRRRKYGDKGATFSKGKKPTIGGGIIGTITTMVTKDLLLIKRKPILIISGDFPTREIYDENDTLPELNNPDRENMEE